ncbi:MAG: potassium channel family protein [Micromonosporaceae bacterium]
MTARADKRAARLRPFLAKRGDRYGLLLLLLVFSYLLAAFATGDLITVFETLLFIGSLALALQTSGVRARAARLIIGGTLAGTVIAVVLVLSHATSRDTAVGIANIWTGVVLFVTVGVILRRILTMPMVSLQSIFGAVSAYMIIGLMFASFYAAMSHLDSRPFFANGSPGNTRTFQYFSFTTLTTLGYGDFTAAQNAGRAVAMMEALGGQVFLATLVARLVASFRPPRRTDGAELADSASGPVATGPGPGAVANTGARQAGTGPGGAGGNSGASGGNPGAAGSNPGAAGSDPGGSGDDGQAARQRGPRTPRPVSRQMRPGRQARVKWHGRRRR